MPFDHFFKTTGQICILADKNIPLVWAGISGEKPDLKGLLHVQDNGSAKNGSAKNAGLGKTKSKRCIFDGKEYQYKASNFIDLFPAQGLIRLAGEAAMLWIAIGEPAALIDNARDKVLKEGARIRNNILITTVLIIFALLGLTVFLMGLIGRKIAKPVAMAAEMSNKIASGDLTHVLDASSSDETGMLLKSMNLMTGNLKILEEKTKRQMRSLEESENRFRNTF